MDRNKFKNTIKDYKNELNNSGKLNLSLEECKDLYKNDYYIVVKDGFVIDIKTKD